MLGEQIKIDKGIPLPAKKTGPNSRYPWKQMEVGDSFLVAGATSTKAFYSTMAKANKAHAPRHFTSRLTKDGVRIWRIDDVKPNGAEQKPEGGETMG